MRTAAFAPMRMPWVYVFLPEGPARGTVFFLTVIEGGMIHRESVSSNARFLRRHGDAAGGTRSVD